ncbi:unnamed protein product [Ilex paraguariensis]|uniref:CUE domain-containing protein n=1 Tax=Ilex paraguariensis TaxID=185542 RepID=A0ABC8U253_9AQUA
MGFNKVHRVLQEIFPHVAEIDARLLRAVAVEHRKDANVAVEAVLTEVIPFLSERTMATNSSNESEIAVNSSEVDITDADTTVRSDEGLLADSICMDEALKGSSFYDANESHDQVCADDGNDELVLSQKCDESCDKGALDMSSRVTSIALIHDNGTSEHHHNFHQKHVVTESESSPIVEPGLSSLVSSTTLESCDFDMVVQGESHHHVHGNLLEVDSSMVQLAESPEQECVQNVPESGLQLVAMPDMVTADVEQPEGPEPSNTFNAASKKDICTCEMVDLDGDLNDMITRSARICSTDLLEDIIEEARGSKKTLFSAMQSVISLMRELELQEKAVEEAAEAGLDILVGVEDLKQKLQHEKEANDMRAGEVYGERAILATEVRELQSRVLSLSDERDKSLAILAEMRQTVEVRLAEAEKLRKEAEQERLEKVESAWKAFAEQELIMEKVVQESKLLKQEAEKNCKLREFLMDRGCVVDMLQGEMKLLKEKFDKLVPLGKSLSSAQASCILASSGSSLKNMAPDQVPEQDDETETENKTSPTPLIHEKLVYGEETARDDHKALVEDGWEFFDN